MNIEIPIELLMSPYAWIIGYFLISFLLVKPFKWFWGLLGEGVDKGAIGVCSFCWPVGVPFCLLIIIIILFIKVYSYLIGD